ncbi:right-handed parallel beta-helix repeat-containing protein [bacterium]|nr:right-handed parallel beta-helix repeat-containing protein [bacterium]
MRRLLCLLAVLLPLAAAGAAEVFVAPNGSDDNPGTQAKPFATLQHARDVVRELRAAGKLPAGDTTVFLRGGTYSLAAPLELTAADSGTEQGRLVFRPWRGEQVWLSGGRTIAPSQFKPVTAPALASRLDPAARGKVLVLDLQAAGIPADVDVLPDVYRGFSNKHPVLMELFCGGERMQPARWPNEGFAHYGEIVDPGYGLRDRSNPQAIAKFTYEGDRPQRWRVEDGVWLQGYWARAYMCETVRVGKIDPVKKQIDFAAPNTYGLDTWGAKRFFAINVLEELDRPGEWFLDRKQHLLLFWPPADLKKAQTVVSVLDKPMVSLTDASYVTFDHLGLENGRWDGLSMTNGAHNRIVGCTIRNVGHHAVEVNGGTDHGVVGCDIHDTGYGGVRLSGGDRTTLTPCNHFADNNHIHHTSINVRTHAGPLSLRGVGLRASHNLLHHEPHSAVWYQGNDLLMEHNEIYWAHTETTEGGVFYTGYDWTTQGNVIRYNYIHDINDSLEGSPTGCNIVHEDDCSAGTAFTGNLCVRCGYGISLAGGPDNSVGNNIFVDVKCAVNLSDRGLVWWTWTKQPDGTVTVVDTRNGATSNNLLTRLLRTPYKQPPWSTKYPWLVNILEMDPVGAPWRYHITRNISYGAGKLISISRGVKPEWGVNENNWDEGNPGFVNAARGDYRLKPDAPMLKRGFEPLPLEQIGLVNDATRASWPVKPEPAPAGWQPRWLTLLAQEKQAPMNLPIVAAERVAAAITIDGVVDPKEWNPAQATGMADEGLKPVALPWLVDGQKAPLPSEAWLEVDDDHLYVAFVNAVDPAKGASGGHQWGKDDAVEIALAERLPDKLGPIVVLRGYSDGHFESSNEAGAPARIVQQAAQGVRYAAKTVDAGRWSAEFAIPFASLGLNPKQRNPRLQFNLSVRKPAGDQWVMLKQSGGFTWEVANAALLWLKPFGNVALGGSVPSQARFDVIAVTDGLTLKALKGCEVATWAKPLGSRLTGATGDLPADKWTPFVYSFVSDKDGQVRLELMGRQHLSEANGQFIPVWTSYDSLTASGATLANGDFEAIGPEGTPVGWQRALEKAYVVRDARLAASGSNFVKTWHNGRFTQVIDVKAGQTVTLTARVRGEGAQ